MSFYEILFKIPKNRKIKGIEKIVIKHINNEAPFNTGIDRKNSDVKIYGEMSEDYDFNNWVSIFDFILKEGGSDTLIKVFHDSVGETSYYSKIANEIKEFDTIEDLYEEFSQQKGIGFCFSEKAGNDNTLLIRLRIKSKKKREKLKEIFEIKEENRFLDLFNSYNTKNIKWPSFRGYDGAWYDGPENLFEGFSFIIEEEKYLYIGYNLEPVRNINEESIIVLLETILFTGITDKIWAKHRGDKGKERTFMEVDGEIYSGSLKDKTEDDFWNFK